MQDKARPTAPITIDFEEAKIDQVFAELNQCHLPGVAVGLAIDGKPVYRKGFGLANLELPMVLTPSIGMRIGSTTKHFTCLAFMLLVEDGLAAIDDPIGKFLPDIHPSAARVTMRQLMMNTSGLIDPYDICFQFSGQGEGVTSDELVAYFQEISAVNAEPGTAWNYNNGGFELVRTVVQRLSGQSLADFMRDRIFEPIGMYDTSLQPMVYTDFLPNRATAHMRNKAGQFESWSWVEQPGCGGIVSSVTDMLRWTIHMDAPRVGSKETWKLIQTPHILPNGTCTHYGFGLKKYRYRGVDRIFHAGGGLGSSALMLKVPEARLDIVITNNRGGIAVSSLAERVLEACLPDLEPAPTAGEGTLLIGVYRSPETNRVLQLRVKEGRQYVANGGLEWPFAPDEDGVLWPFGEGFSVVEQGIRSLSSGETPDTIEFRNFGTPDRLTRVQDAVSDDQTQFIGRYRADSIDTDVVIEDRGGQLELRALGRFGTTTQILNEIADGVLHATSPHAIIPPGGILAFSSDRETFWFSTWQTWAVRFERLPDA